MSNFETNKLNISIFPIFKVLDKYEIFDKDLIALLIISLSSIFSFLDPIISKPI